ncbi:thioredoxin TrxC [Oceanimonas baumannii]|uniref:thioredoxin TrxC n=1 Tax=Oceanimonas baumannii TaxID=129578 RepID=UPI001D187977|nr:thioredoxin TrxC [Oceanimonas baumannii]MCC4265227.1 thioredoxin TrxC [Oceanimonas baumannii]
MSEQFLVCPACQARNRVPGERLQQGPKCGKCKAALVLPTALELDGPRLDRLLANESLPLVIDFWAPWCGPCKMMAPIFEAAASEHAGRLRLAKLNTELHSQAAARFGIRSIPTLIAFRDGQEIARQSGALSAGQLGQWLHQVLTS